MLSGNMEIQDIFSGGFVVTLIAVELRSHLAAFDMTVEIFFGEKLSTGSTLGHLMGLLVPQILVVANE